MAIRTSQAIIVGLGMVLSLTGIVTGKFGFDAQLHHANIASAANWHDPPIKDSERYWMNFPARYFVIAGVALFVTAIARAIVSTVRKSRRV
jgi:hypothetical protein